VDWPLGFLLLLLLLLLLLPSPFFFFRMEQFQADHQNFLTDVAYDFHGKKLATGGNDAKMAIWEKSVSSNPPKPPGLDPPAAAAAAAAVHAALPCERILNVFVPV